MTCSYISTASYMLMICNITCTTSCIIYEYHACTTMYLLLPPSFYHSLGRFLTTLGLRAQIGDPLTESALASHMRFLIGTLYRYLYDLFPLSYLSPSFIYVMISDPLLQVFLYLSHAGPQVYMEVMYCTEA